MPRCATWWCGRSPGTRGRDHRGRPGHRLRRAVRAFVDGLRAEHRLGVGHQPRPGDDACLRHLLEHQVASVHPLVRVHTETGERVLFVNGSYVEQIAGVPRPESAARATTPTSAPRITHRRVMLAGEVPVGVYGRRSEAVTGTAVGRW